ncbi:hypothetical protein [Bacillus pumilus]|uniref:hypothetical protein n=1 Tax=Bacillus pumilus TaxID=1408 RepID=UPI0021502FC7|nr:hypothetical protein [Bacillus pumilus]MCR4354812.1 hypothetical protein [Bacillus pumilus]MCY7502490.1 hypothetical protein [Bacillus pumilus]MED4439877.1 hypothetical protein [Bacillus pumilus]MED4675778.1 hypothetical protein [Bacillus pumilus]
MINGGHVCGGKETDATNTPCARTSPANVRVKQQPSETGTIWLIKPGVATVPTGGLGSKPRILTDCMVGVVGLPTKRPL